MSVASVLSAVGRLAEETEFDPNQVTPGFEGFIFTGLLAAGIIVLGFLLVRRLRRNSYRAEVREQIERELAERDGGDAPGESGDAGDAAGRDPEPRG